MPSFEIEHPHSEVSGHNTRPLPPNGGERLPQERGRRSRLRQLYLWTGANNLLELWAWARCKRLVRPTASDLSKTLRVLDASSMDGNEAAADAESPIFLLATGWRTGSTLLQRILVTDHRLLLWGEPFGEMALVSTLAEIVTRLSTFPDLTKRYVRDDLTGHESFGLFQVIRERNRMVATPAGLAS